MSPKWKPKPATPTPPPLKLVGLLHAHVCVECRHRYEDRCDIPLTDDICLSCRYGHPWPLWRTTRLPQECCRTESRLATPAERALHHLGGQATWWLCKTCHRTHPFDPSQETP